MNKVFKFLLSLVLILSCGKVFAQAINYEYSEWSTMYPSNIPEVFIDSETRYHFYREVNGEIEYTDEYYTELDGYIKDEASAREFYRYILNENIIFNGKNQMVHDDMACKKNFCYIVSRGAPAMINTDSKFDPDYSEETMPEVRREAVPFTGDQVAYYFIGLFLSIFIVAIVFIIKRNKNKQLIRA